MLHRFLNPAGIPYSAIYKDGQEVGSHERRKEKDMIEWYKRWENLEPKEEEKKSSANISFPIDTFSEDNLREMLRNADNAKAYRFCATKDGKIFMHTEISDFDFLKSLAFYSNSFPSFGGYAGEEAAEDDLFVGICYDSLKDRWNEFISEGFPLGYVSV